jgi:hypothetical protein
MNGKLAQGRLWAYNIGMSYHKGTSSFLIRANRAHK